MTGLAAEAGACSSAPLVAGALLAGAAARSGAPVRGSIGPVVRGSLGSGSAPWAAPPTSVTAPLLPIVPTALLPSRVCASALTAAQARQAAMTSFVFMLH